MGEVALAHCTNSSTSRLTHFGDEDCSCTWLPHNGFDGLGTVLSVAAMLFAAFVFGAGAINLRNSERRNEQSVLLGTTPSKDSQKRGCFLSRSWGSYRPTLSLSCSCCACIIAIGLALAMLLSWRAAPVAPNLMLQITRRVKRRARGSSGGRW